MLGLLGPSRVSIVWEYSENLEKSLKIGHEVLGHFPCAKLTLSFEKWDYGLKAR
jgi:hypothetical protein